MSTGAFAQHKLEYKPSGSTPLQYKAHTEMHTLETVMGQHASVSAVSDQQVSMTGKRSGSNLVYNITIDSSSVMTILPNGDTTRSASSPTVGQTKQTVMRPDGKEISTTWLDTTFAKTQAGQPKDLGSFFFKLPDKKVSVGSAWHDTKVDTMERGSGQAEDVLVTTNSNYRLVGEETVGGTPCVKIEFVGKVILNGHTSYHGVDFSMDGTGNVTGTVYFDYTNGRIVKLNGSSEQKIVMASSGQHKMSIPMTQKTSYDLFLVR